MNDFINKVLDHPIKTAVVVGAITGGIAKVVDAVRKWKVDTSD